MTTTALPPALSALTARLGVPADSLDPVDQARAQAALADATALALAEVTPRTADVWAVGAAPAVVHLVILTAARRGYENPRGIQSETLGAHAVTLSEASGVYLTGREVALIRRTGGRRTGATTTRTASAFE